MISGLINTEDIKMNVPFALIMSLVRYLLYCFFGGLIYFADFVIHLFVAYTNFHAIAISNLCRETNFLQFSCNGCVSELLNYIYIYFRS